MNLKNFDIKGLKGVHDLIKVVCEAHPALTFKSGVEADFVSGNYTYPLAFLESDFSSSLDVKRNEETYSIALTIADRVDDPTDEDSIIKGLSKTEQILAEVHAQLDEYFPSVLDLSKASFREQTVDDVVLTRGEFEVTIMRHTAQLSTPYDGFELSYIPVTEYSGTSGLKYIHNATLSGNTLTFYKPQSSFDINLSGLTGNNKFNGNRTITRNISGLYGVNVGTTGTTEEFLNKLLFIDVPPSAAISASNSSRELGSSTAVELTWSVTKNTNPITEITVAGVGILGVTGENQSGTANQNTGMDVNTTFSIVVKDNTGLQGSANATVSYYPARFYGAFSGTPAEVIASLSDGTNIDYTEYGFSKQLASNYVLNNNYDCSGGKYIYVLYPSWFGTPSLVRSGLLDFSAYTIQDVTIKDIFGISRTYKLLYTGIQFGSAVNINIIS